MALATAHHSAAFMLMVVSRVMARILKTKAATNMMVTITTGAMNRLANSMKTTRVGGLNVARSFLMNSTNGARTVLVRTPLSRLAMSRRNHHLDHLPPV
jgi:hypothetical protein